MASTYSDGWITCTEEEIQVRGYYFPWGTKRIPYGRLRSVRRVQISAVRGRGRLWGTANPRYWASLDPARMSKHAALVLDVGARVRPFLTPNDPQAVIDAIGAHCDVEVIDDASAGPII